MCTAAWPKNRWLSLCTPWRLITAAISLALACAVFAGWKSDQQKLQGQWKMREMTGCFDFGLGSTKEGGWPIITFDQDQFSYFYERLPQDKVTGSFTCDTSKGPKQITFYFGDRTVVGIYGLFLGQFLLCIDENERAPPREFRTGPGGWPALLTFERPRIRADSAHSSRNSEKSVSSP